MARSAPLNLLFDAYKADAVAGLEPLLTAIRIRAVNVLQDEDLAQEFLIDLRPALFELPEGGNFAAWINIRLRWTALHAHRDDARNNKEVPASYVELGFGAEDSPMNNEDKLDLLAFKDATRRDLPVDLTQITDPTLRKLAESLLQGYTQEEAAQQLGVSLGSIKQRLFRNRKKLALAA
jgi:RNA polymerase sigma factor (sigma-70 family)